MANKRIVIFLAKKISFPDAKIIIGNRKEIKI